jgi:hypothetical protein
METKKRRSGRKRRARQRWFRVRVEAEGGAYVGSLLLDSLGLREHLDGERAYLGLWNAVREGSSVVEDFIALHKSVIRSVVLVEDEKRARRSDGGA